MSDEQIYLDEDGNEYVLDESGNHRPPLQTAKSNNESDFRTYDTSQGHCALCGSLTCNGSCFK